MKWGTAINADTARIKRVLRDASIQVVIKGNLRLLPVPWERMKISAIVARATKRLSMSRPRNAYRSGPKSITLAKAPCIFIVTIKRIRGNRNPAEIIAMAAVLFRGGAELIYSLILDIPSDY